MKKYHVYLLLVSICFLSAARAQDEIIDQRLIGKTNFSDIMNTVQDYYNDPATRSRLSPRAFDHAVKQWQRYEWYMGRRLGPNGEFVNIHQKMIEATGLQRQELSGRTESTAGAWTPLGPMNTTNGIGRVDRLAFHPTDANTVYAGSTAGGLWKTTDGGNSWSNISADIPSPGISGIAIDPSNPNTIYILTGDGDSNIGINGLVQGHGYMRLSVGVLKSTNGGANWSQTGVFPGADYSSLTGYRLIMNPADANTLYACTSQGLYMTINGGVTWGLVNGGARFYNMKFKPGSNNICYAVSSTGNSNARFWKSTTSGISWDTNPQTNLLLNNPTRRVEMAVTPANPERVYLLAGGVQVAGTFKGLLMSNNSGDSFFVQSNSPNILGNSNLGADANEQSNYDLAITVSNQDASMVVTGAVFVWQTPDTGNNWNFQGNTHGDIHDLGYHPVGNKLWAATDGGVYSSLDNGQTWTTHFEGMNTTQFYRMAVSPSDYLNMIAGSQDNAVKRRTGATSTFDQIACCDGFALGYDFGTSNTMYAVTNATIRRSINGGNNFVLIPPPNNNIPFSMSMDIHTSQANSLFVGLGLVYGSVDGGNNWNILLNQGGAWFLRTCPSNGSRIYVAGGTAYNSATGVMRRSDDGGANWTTVSGNADFPSPVPRITYINVDPTNSMRVWVTFGGFTDGVKVMFSGNGGVNWDNVSGTLPNVPVNCIALDNNNNAYIGTDNGVYYRGNGMNDWVPFYNNLPYVPVTDLIISEAENRIRAATFGRGIWSSDLYTACPADLVVSGTLEGQEFYEASNSVSSTASLQTSAGTKVLMRGGNQVLLQEGFTARENTQFKAMIGPCGSGGVAGFTARSVDSLENLPAAVYLPPANRKASIHIVTADANRVNVKIDQSTAGETSFVLTNEKGKILKTETNNRSAGTWTKGIMLNNFPPGTYYLNLFLDKRLEHRQEVIIP